MRTLIIIPTAAEVTAECYKSVLAQTDRNRSVLVAALRPIALDADPEKNRIRNIIRNRNHIRPIALASDAEWFLWVDSDFELPADALVSLLEAGEKLVGGGYKDHVEEFGLGCCLMHRSILEKVAFREGTEEYSPDAAFWQDAKAAGFDAFMAPGLVCRHIAQRVLQFK